MAKLADAIDLGSIVLDVGVQVPLVAPKEKISLDTTKGVETFLCLFSDFLRSGRNGIAIVTDRSIAHRRRNFR